jgi:hypothetical protein
MFEFMHFKQYEVIPTSLNSYVSKSMNSYHLTPWSLINTEHCVFGPEFRCFSLNLPVVSGELKRLVLVLHTGRVPEATGGEMTLKRET